jgi:hypothetical protein
MVRLIALSFVLVLGLVQPVSGATIGIQPDPLNIVPGQTAWAEILIQDLNGVVVGGFDLTVFYPDALSVGGPEFGFLLGTPDVDAIVQATIASGWIRLLEVSLLSEAELQALQSDSFTLARIPIGASGSLIGTLRIEGILSDAAGFPVDVTFQDAAVVSNVPEPATTILVGFVLLGLVLRGLRIGSIGRSPRHALDSADVGRDRMPLLRRP